jgi:hypothetical protein
MLDISWGIETCKDASASPTGETQIASDQAFSLAVLKQIVLPTSLGPRKWVMAQAVASRRANALEHPAPQIPPIQLQSWDRDTELAEDQFELGADHDHLPITAYPTLKFLCQRGKVVDGQLDKSRVG